MKTDSKEEILQMIKDQIRTGFLEMPISRFADYLGIDPVEAYECVKKLENDGEIIEIGRGQLNRPLYVLGNN